MLKVAVAVSCHLGSVLSYQNKTYSDCHVAAASSGRVIHGYSIHCGDKKNEFKIGYVEGGSSAEILDEVSLEPKAKCTVESAEIAKLIQAFQDHKKEIENPKCFLNHWHGQVTFHSGEMTGRCSIRLNKDLSEQFEKIVKAPPNYQCEHEYFMIGPRVDGTTIYKRTKSGWEYDCKAPIQIEEVENIDWNHPPDYWAPPEPHVMPK